jgi:hypothetical protein
MKTKYYKVQVTNSPHQDISVFMSNDELAVGDSVMDTVSLLRPFPTYEILELLTEKGYYDFIENLSQIS